MNFYGNENRAEHTIVGRLMPFAEALHRSVMKAAEQPVPEINHSSALPPWCHKMCDELTKSAFGSLVKASPRRTKFSCRNYGRIVGMLLRGVVFLLKEAPAQLKRDGLLDLSPEQKTKLEAHAGLPLLFAAATKQLQKPISNQEELLKAGEEQIEKQTEALLSSGFLFLRYMLNRPVEEQHEFLCGIPQGFVLLINYHGEFAGGRNRLDVFLVLAMHWPEIVEMQKAQPPKTRRDLLKWLEAQENRRIVENEKLFFELCGDIGLSLAPPGHPQNSASI